MSIFKDSLPPYVQNQLRAREIIIGQGTVTTAPPPKPSASPSVKVTYKPYGSESSRSDTFLRYVSGKNAWVKMQSFVDFNGKIGTQSYSGDQLARKYILEGGTLYDDPNNPFNFRLREGIGKPSSVYGGNVDDGISPKRPLGIRPMPGITSAQVVNKSAYGSLREATIKFYCWDKHQLEELELLYMRTGYSVLLEWGWSQYLNSSDLANIKIENFDSPTLNSFNITTNPNYNNDEIIYESINNLNKKSYGNYDGMLGYVKNFSWQLMPNGGFECTTVLISRGEVISTLKVSSNSDVMNLTGGSNTVPTITQFEQIFLNYSALVNTSELNAGGEFGLAPTSSGNNPLAFQITSTTSTQLLSTLKSLADPSTGTALYTDGGAQYNTTFLSGLDPANNLNYFGGSILTEGTTFENGGYGIEYIRLDAFVAVLNLCFNYKDQNNKLVADIRIPYDNLCLASKDSVSVDPTTCIIYNPKAEGVVLSRVGGFDPNLVKNDGINISKIAIPPFLKNDSRGYIRNIYVSIPKIIGVFRSKMSGDSDVNMVDYLKTLLSEISRALGGINNFQLHTTKSSIQIIDVKYLEEGDQSNTKFEFDLIGLKSVCRDVKIQSRIFESQSTMMAIAAQSKDNVGDLYSSTQVYFNQGLTDRLVNSKKVSNRSTTPDDFIKNLYEVVSNLGYYIYVKVLGDTEFLGIPRTPASKIIVPKPEEISNAVSTLKSFIYQLRGEDIKYKALIPFELEITLDGIAGMVQGQIFKINQNILPQSYSNKNIGFIITGISHSLQNNDWTTTIKTQVCVLNPDGQSYSSGKSYNNYIKKINAATAANKTGAFIVFCIADYLSEIFEKLVLTDKKSGGNFDTAIKAVRTGNLSNFYTYATAWHNKQLASIPAADRTAISFPDTINKLFNPTGNPSDEFHPESVDALVYDSNLISTGVGGVFKDNNDSINPSENRKLSFIKRGDAFTNTFTINDIDTSGNLVGSYVTDTETNLLNAKIAANASLKNKGLPSLLVPPGMPNVVDNYNFGIEVRDIRTDVTVKGKLTSLGSWFVVEQSPDLEYVGSGRALYEYRYGNRQAIYDGIFNEISTLMTGNGQIPLFSRPNPLVINAAKANPNFKSRYVEDNPKISPTYDTVSGIKPSSLINNGSYFLLNKNKYL